MADVNKPVLTLLVLTTVLVERAILWTLITNLAQISMSVVLREEMVVLLMLFALTLVEATLALVTLVSVEMVLIVLTLTSVLLALLATAASSVLILLGHTIVAALMVIPKTEMLQERMGV